MADDSTATLEEAKRCFKCDQPGLEISDMPARERHQGRVKIMECQNPLCLNTGPNGRWIIQVRPDGTIPKQRPSNLRSFPALTPGQQAAALRELEDTARRDLRGEI